MAQDDSANGRDGIEMKPPYVSYVTFKNFLVGLSKHPLPGRIDNSLMHNLSGGVQSQLLLALRYLGLIGDNGEVTDLLKGLVAAADTSAWATELRAVVESGYGELVRGLHLESATADQLREQFRERGGVEGSSCDKAIRFYLKALEDAAINHSPHFKKTRTRRASSARQPRRSRKSGAKTAGGDESRAETEAGTVVIPIPLRGKKAGKIVMPEGFDQGDLAIVNVAVEMLKVYAAQGESDDA